MRLLGLVNHRILGFRVMELAASGLLTVLVLTVYMAKTRAGDKTDDIDHIEQQIADTQTEIRLLKVEVANEERPDRLSALAAQYLNMGPVSPKHEIDADALADVAEAGDKPAKPAQAVRTATAPAATSAATLQPAAYAAPTPATVTH